MKIYIITLVGTMFLSYLAETLQDNAKSRNENAQLNKYILILLIAFLTIISGCRYMNYYASDEYNYRSMVESMIGQSLNLSEILTTREWLFQVIIWICANVFKDGQALIFIAALITNASIVSFLGRYAKPFWFAIFIYICSGTYLATMNVLRQYIAVAIIIWCYPVIKENNFKKYLLLVLLASSIHQSALIMIPIYFFIKRNKFDAWTFIVVIATMVVLLNFESVMINVLTGTEYEYYVDNILSSGYGVKIIRVAVWLIPYGIVLYFYKYFQNVFNVGYEILITIIIDICVLVVSTQYVFVARFESYFSLITYIAIIKIPQLFVGNQKRFVTLLIVVLFFSFGAYQQIITSEYHNILFENISGVL